MLESTGLRPRLDRTLKLADVGDELAAMAAGDVLGKIVVVP